MPEDDRSKLDEIRSRMPEVCPRCGKKVRYYEFHNKGGRIYVYAVHEVRFETDKLGRRRKKYTRCYLGPLDSYVYVTRTHEKREGLVFRGLHDRDRAIMYLDALIAYLSTHELTPEVALRLADKLESLAKKLREAARRWQARVG